MLELRQPIPKKAREAMPPTESPKPKPIATRNSSEFKPELYASIPTGELVVFAVQVLQADGSPVAVEDAVSICFRFFPRSFALKNYFYWPDSALVTRRLHDAKEKGWLKGNAADGFETRGQGRQVAKHAAKALGVIFPAPPKVEAPAEAEKPEAGETPLVKKEAQAVSVKKTKAASPASKKHTAKPALKKQAKAGKESVKAVAPARKTPAVAAPVKKAKGEKRKTQSSAPKPRRKETKARPAKALKAKVARLMSGITPPPAKARVEKRGEKSPKARGAKATQLALNLNPLAAWKKVGGPKAGPTSKEEAAAIVERKPVGKGAAPPAAISKEEKEKAAKALKHLERSDAYQLYRRNGRRAGIGEFDFRNMLFATMESSAETLNRNVELFKRYAGIQYRADLVTFLEFCEGHFAPLLKPKGKR